MRSYKYNRVHTTSFACSTDTSTLSYDRSAQCYCWLLPTDGSRGLRAIADDCRFIWAVGCNFGDRSWPTCSALYSPNLQCFSNPRFPVSFPLTMSSNIYLATQVYGMCLNLRCAKYQYEIDHTYIYGWVRIVKRWTEFACTSRKLSNPNPYP